MSFIKSKSFKYVKNLVIGVGASVVLVGALAKIISHPLADIALTVGLLTEAFLFLMLGIIPPEADYYWEKLYPGLNEYDANLSPLTAGATSAKGPKPLDGEKVENNLSGMLSELQAMSKSLGSLKALQEVDFSKTGEQIKSMNNFYERMSAAMVELNNTVEGTKLYKENLDSMNKNMTSLSKVYSDMFQSTEKQFSSMNSLSDKMSSAVSELNSTLDQTKAYKENLSSLNKSLSGLNNVYGGMLSAMTNLGRNQ
jgi:uncharacterized protein YukE